MSKNDRSKLQGRGILILKRLAVWLVETSCEALLLGLFFVVFYGPDERGFIRDLLLVAVAVALLFVTTGYGLTTAILRSVWSGQRLWLYPIVATIPFFIHSQIFFVVSGGSTSSEKLLIRSAGACIVFACTFVGGCLLRKWANP
jgi:hypothetical protein